MRKKRVEKERDGKWKRSGERKGSREKRKEKEKEGERKGRRKGWRNRDVVSAKGKEGKGR